MLLALLDRLFGGKISTVALASGAVAYEQGDRARGARLVELASSAAPRDVGVQGVAAREATRAGDHAIALKLWERALALEPERLDFAEQAALVQRALGDVEGAARRCEQAILGCGDRDPGFPLMHLLAELRFPGPSYQDWLALFHGELQPRTYLEIGVARGASIALVGPQTRAIGIDPSPTLATPLPGNVSVFRETSDAFFAGHAVRELLGGLPIELAFIDGMHLFEFALRDFIHIEKHCARGATILFDDCWPLTPIAAARDRVTTFWNGDVWRILPALRKYRPELRIRTLATFPAGLCVVRGLDPESRVLADRYEDIVKEFGDLPYAAFVANRETYLGPCANDRQSLKDLLA